MTALDGRFDRYYDPGTDQFLSVDPDVAETGQPYAFTADDPLNSTDPLGLSGDATADIAYNRAHNDVCGSGHGERRCQGLGHDIVHEADSLRHLAAHHYGEIVTVAAIGVAFVPGVDVVELGVAATVALSARIANRSTNDRSAPWSSQNLGANIADTLATAGSFGAITAPAAAAEPLMDELSTAGALALRARLAAPDIIGFGLDLQRSN
jgi:hypothetical protein